MIRTLLRSMAVLSLPAAVLVAVWFSLLAHYYVPHPTLTARVVEDSRRVPDDALLAELSGFYFMGSLDALDDSQTVETAKRLLEHGEFALPGSDPQNVRLPFDSRDLDRGPVLWQLQQASLFVPRLLVRAYRVSGRDDFLHAAREIMLAWARYEGRALVPKGFLWNDHAVAERSLALAEFWTAYRKHASYQDAVGLEILRFAARTGSLLADPSHFTVSTNHGVMQNLALWHLNLVFPLLPDAARYRSVALERLHDQMDLYVDSDGVILEHSAGYQSVGVQLLGMAFRYMSLQAIPVPTAWRSRYDRAQDVLAHLRRPNGSLPVFGDTDDQGDWKGPPVAHADASGSYGRLGDRPEWRPQTPRSWYPTAGYAIWWDGLERWPDERDISQTVVVWSYFPRHGHKHADEGSVLLWANGETWWTNVGYWPYDTPGRADAISWNGSNAPHLSSEPALSDRTTRIVGRGATDSITMIDLERSGSGGFSARRQILQLGRGLWMVVDHVAGAPESESTTVWTTSHEVTMGDGVIPGSIELTSAATNAVLTTFLLSSPDAGIQRVRANEASTLGWNVVAGTPRPASAIVVEQPADASWAVALWSLNDGRPGAPRVTAQPSMSSWQGPDAWVFELPLASGSLRVVREEDSVSVSDEATRLSGRLLLDEPHRIDDEVGAIRLAHSRELAKYPVFSDHLPYRAKATLLCILVFVFQEALFAALRRRSVKHYRFLRAISVLGWAALGIWLVMIRTPLIGT